MDIHCNAGVTSTDLIDDLPRYGTVWYNSNGITNILSLTRVKEKHRVTFDSGPTHINLLSTRVTALPNDSKNHDMDYIS
jgi:hypothetical protein